jgi:hypothetical protein
MTLEEISFERSSGKSGSVGPLPKKYQLKMTGEGWKRNSVFSREDSKFYHWGMSQRIKKCIIKRMRTSRMLGVI